LVAAAAEAVPISAAAEAVLVTAAAEAVPVTATAEAVPVTATAEAVPVTATAPAAQAATSAPPPVAERLGTVRVLSLPHTTAAVKIDGVLDDPAWADALVIEPDTETDPLENVPAPVKTKAYLIEDDKRLLIAFDARDPHPKQIRAYLRDRDSAFDDDFVGVVLDTFDDRRHAYEFFVNPLGVQMDLTNDDVNKNESSSWDAIWDSAGKITDQGYVVEMAIPFSQLRFPHSTGKETWAVDVLRFRPRQDRERISNNPLERGRNCYLCQLSEIRGFAGVEPGKNIEVVPSLTASRTDERDPATGGLTKGDTDPEVGLDVRWGITPDLTANLTVNPDFSQVEADVPQLSENNRFSLFFPETRPFFLEGADYFATPINAVFTRTVADPDFGAKLTGRSDKNTYGIFVAKDTVTNLIFPAALGSQNGVLEQTNRSLVGRYRRGFGESSTIGALVTERSGEDYSNDVEGIDGRYRISDQHNIRFQYLHSETEYPREIVDEFDQPAGLFDGGALRVNYDYSSRNWFASFDYQAMDRGFRADSGFVTQVDYEDRKTGFGHVWQGAERNWWNRMSVGVSTGDTYDREGRILGRHTQLQYSLNGPLQSYVEFDLNKDNQFWNGRLYDTNNVLVYAQLRPRSGLNVTLSANIGKQIDFANSRLGDQVNIQPEIDWNVNRHLLVRLRHTSAILDSEQGARIFDARIDDLRLTWQFNLRSFLRATLQRQDVERNIAAFIAADTASSSRSASSQLLYSYKLNPQTVFFLGYSDDRNGALLGRLVQTDRTFFVKFSYAWAP
jgi:hypothetical protein